MSGPQFDESGALPSGSPPHGLLTQVLNGLIDLGPALPPRMPGQSPG
jgi:hypothetical protein